MAKKTCQKCRSIACMRLRCGESQRRHALEEEGDLPPGSNAGPGSGVGVWAGVGKTTPLYYKLPHPHFNLPLSGCLSFTQCVHHLPTETEWHISDIQEPIKHFCTERHGLWKSKLSDSDQATPKYCLIKNTRKITFTNSILVNKCQEKIMPIDSHLMDKMNASVH